MSRHTTRCFLLAGFSPVQDYDSGPLWIWKNRFFNCRPLLYEPSRPAWKSQAYRNKKADLSDTEMSTLWVINSFFFSFDDTSIINQSLLQHERNSSGTQATSLDPETTIPRCLLYISAFQPGVTVAPRGHLATSGDVCYGHPVSRSQGCRSTSYRAQDSPTTENYPSQMSVLMQRSPVIHM